jgi:anthranilate 1,2-dioxygenase large subunit
MPPDLGPKMSPKIEWQTDDYSRVPYILYHDASIFEQERDKIFSGKTWSYLALDAELPNPGDFKTTYMGDIPILVSRDRSGVVHAFVNRCAHRGALVRREARGNAKNHTCIYHRWCFALDGQLTGVPFRNGVNGEGGLPPDFKLSDHGLKRLRVGLFKGIIFGTLGDNTEELEDYLGPEICEQIARIFQKPVKVLGYQRQRMNGNWKLYVENSRDNYHASLLHAFLTAFGMGRATQKGGQAMDERHRHTYTFDYANSDSEEVAKTAYATATPDAFKLKLRDASFLKMRPERNDNLRGMIINVFPCSIFTQSGNAMAIRQVRPKSPGVLELLFTLVGYEDDDDDMVERRLLAANMSGPAGYVAMEDGEAVEIVSAATQSQPDGTSVIEVGGKGPLPRSFGRATDLAVRGFWSYYAEVMGIEPAGGIR